MLIVPAQRFSRVVSQSSNPSGQLHLSLLINIILFCYLFSFPCVHLVECYACLLIHDCMWMGIHVWVCMQRSKAYIWNYSLLLFLFSQQGRASQSNWEQADTKDLPSHHHPAWCSDAGNEGSLLTFCIYLYF